MNSLTLSHRLLLRQGRSGALSLLVAGLVVATAALVAVSVFTDRVGRALERQAGEALAADVAVNSRAPIPESFEDEAQRRGLATARLITLNTALFIGDASLLVEVKGVSDGYPLRGELETAPFSDGSSSPTPGIPAVGEAWMEPRGLRQLGAEVGDIALFGVHELPITRALTFEPDRSGGPFLLAPRLMVHLDDLQSSELLGPGTRARYRLLVAGAEAAVDDFRSWLLNEIDPANQAIVTASDADDQTGAALAQARRFLSVAALTTLILAAVAVLLSSLRFARSQRDLVALLKSFGASGSEVMAALTLMLLWLVAIAILVGGVLGLFAQAAIAQALVDGQGTALPPARLWPVLSAGLFTLLMATGFALPPLLNLRQVPPMRILNQSLDQRIGLSWALWALPIVSAMAIPVIQLGNFKLAAIVLGGSLALAGLLAAGGWTAMRFSGMLASRARASWRFGLAGLRRRRGAGVIQITALGLGLMALLLLMIVRTELLGQWRGSLPESTPDHFAVNIQPDQVAAVRETLMAAGAQRLQIRPMANVNLVDSTGELNDDRFGRQVNVSWIDELPPANRVAEGEFFTADASGEVSLAERWAERTGARLGDTLTFESGAERFTARVTSIRDVEWDSFNVNFFILMSPDAGELLPHQNIASFYLAEGDGRVLRQISRDFPNVSVIDVGALLERVSDIIDRVSSAAQVVFIFTLLAGLIVLLAALEATRDERRHESALIRTLGADNALIRRGLLIEYGIMALIAASLATVGAALVGWLLARELFDFSYQPSALLFAAGFVSAFVLVVGSGWWGNRSVLATPPVRILRTGKA
jgi:putative ABC transport system permease protein